MHRLVSLILVIFSLVIAAPIFAQGSGLIALPSPYSVPETLDRLATIVEDKGITVFARIDHAEGAKQADMELRATELLIFGNPRVGTPLMQCAQSIAIDLPQKALAWQDAEGQVWLGYNDPAYLAERHQLSGCDEAINKVSKALSNFVKAATAP